MQLIANYKTLPEVKLKQIKILLIMKLTTCLMLFACLQVGAEGVAQKVTLNESKTSLEKVLKKIGQQTGYTFLYENKVLEKASPVTLNVNEASLEQALNLCFRGQPLTYKIFERTVVIKEKVIQYALKKEKVFVIKPLANIVHGKVSNSKGEPLAGVSVAVKATTTGTSTNENGNYSIDVPDGGILIFSYVGFVSREVAIKNQNTVNVVLEEENAALNEVVVTALGIKRETKSLTYSTQSVDANDMTEARELNIMNSLEGKVAGLSINSSGTGLGGDVRVVLRGNRSISGDSQPLYVIDGVIINGNPSSLSSDNIASLTVL